MFPEESKGLPHKHRKVEKEQEEDVNDEEQFFLNSNIPKEKLESWKCEVCGEQNPRTTVKCLACGKYKAEWRFGDNEDIGEHKERERLRTGPLPKGRLWNQACRSVEKKERRGTRTPQRNSDKTKGRIWNKGEVKTTERTREWTTKKARTKTRKSVRQKGEG